MKVLSLLQPWASLVVMGHKTIVTRSWMTPYRGLLLIHASKGRAGKALAGLLPFTKHIEDFNTLPFGCIIGEAVLVDVVRAETLLLPQSTWHTLTLEEQAFGDHTTGRYAWLLENAVMWDEAVAATGKLGLWEF